MISFARNAFLRAWGGPIDVLTLPEGARAMRRFSRDYRPQHAELDVLECSWGPVDGRFELAITRRMQRHDHPETTLSLVFEYALTPARMISGASTDITGSDGYRAVSRAAIRSRRLEG